MFFHLSLLQTRMRMILIWKPPSTFWRSEKKSVFLWKQAKNGSFSRNNYDKWEIIMTNEMWSFLHISFRDRNAYRKGSIPGPNHPCRSQHPRTETIHSPCPRSGTETSNESPTCAASGSRQGLLPSSSHGQRPPTGKCGTAPTLR